VLTGNQASRQFAQSCPLRLPGPSNCPYGGACHKCPAPRVQAKLRIGRPDDKYEREADRVADKVMHMPEPYTQKEVPISRQSQSIQTQQACTKCDDELCRQPLEKKVLKARQASGHASQVQPVLTDQVSGLHGRGQPLPKFIRTFFEPRFGYNFSQVRIHNDMQASKTAKSMNARAFTFGLHIVFGDGQYAPETTAGKRLLAHELTHAIQQQKEKMDTFVQLDPDCCLDDPQRFSKSVADDYVRNQIGIPPLPVQNVLCDPDPTHPHCGVYYTHHLVIEVACIDANHAIASQIHPFSGIVCNYNFDCSPSGRPVLTERKCEPSAPFMIFWP
jgi:hypothetical protein